MSLTHKQAELLRFIARYQDENGGVPPSTNEMCAAMNVKNRSNISFYTDQLVERGYLRKMKGRRRGLEILRMPAAPKSADLIGNRCPHCSGIISIPFKGQVS